MVRPPSLSIFSGTLSIIANSPLNVRYMALALRDVRFWG
jgi:hypothetical protein